MRARVKVCCIQSPEEAWLAIEAGADAIGLVGLGLSGPEVIDDATIAAIAASVPPFVATVLLTRQTDPEQLAAQVSRCGTNTLQICDTSGEACWTAVRQAAPGVSILQVVHVTGPQAVDEALAVAPHVDGILLDSGTPSGPTPVFGGTGATHDWSISAEIVRRVDKPVYLAGGLREANVATAWSTVMPFGLDLCSGVRRDGKLDPDRLTAFMRAVRTLH